MRRINQAIGDSSGACLTGKSGGRVNYASHDENYVIFP
jgi:hypothetical protein